MNLDTGLYSLGRLSIVMTSRFRTWIAYLTLLTPRRHSVFIYITAFVGLEHLVATAKTPDLSKKSRVSPILISTVARVPHALSLSFEATMAHFLRSRLTCFYCNRGSSQRKAPGLEKFQCEHCDAENYLDAVSSCSIYSTRATWFL